MENNKELLRAEGVCKQFGGVPVLQNVDLEIEYGEVHALMGENGAGKSTLIKIITGVFTKDAGEIFIDGKHVEIHNRKDAALHGIQVIYQELSLIPALSVTENIFLGQEDTKLRVLQKKGMKERVASLIEHYGFELDPDAIVETMGMAQRQMAEILKALAFKAKLIIMDEPTSALSAAESEKLFDTINGLRDRGVGILYISHRLEEVYRLSDRLTVMRDGKIVGVLNKDEINAQTVTSMMIGHEIKQEKKVRTTDLNTDRCLEVKDLCYKTILKGANITAYGGEILGIGGLVGSGRTELIRCIYGAEKPDSGSITYNGKPIGGSVGKSIKMNIGLVPEDRRTQGFIPLLSIEKNIAIANQDRLSSSWFISGRKEAELADAAIRDYDIRPPKRSIQVGNLSGGNQQKVVLGKWLSRDLEVLLLDEPTLGVDIGVKEDIYGYMRQLARKGAIIIMVSSDLAELTYISDRILVMHEGIVFKEFPDGNATQTEVLLAASGEDIEGGVPA